MNKKTFCVAFLFLLLTLFLLGLVVYCSMTHRAHMTGFDYLLSLFFVAAAGCMVYNEYKKKRRRHLDEADK